MYLVVRQVDGPRVLRQLGEVRQTFVRAGNENRVMTFRWNDDFFLQKCLNKAF